MFFQSRASTAYSGFYAPGFTVAVGLLLSQEQKRRLGGSGGRGRQRGAVGPGPRPPDRAARGGFAPELRERHGGGQQETPYSGLGCGRLSECGFSSGEQPLKERRL